METKDQAVQRFQERNFQSIPSDWVQTIFNDRNSEHKLPMYGTVWIVEEYWGRKLFTIKSKLLKEYDSNRTQAYNDKNTHCEMAGERAVIDRDGLPTNIFMYELDGRYVMGVHGCGYSSFDGVWDVLYDLFELKWHLEIKE